MIFYAEDLFLREVISSILNTMIELLVFVEFSGGLRNPFLKFDVILSIVRFVAFAVDRSTASETTIHFIFFEMNNRSCFTRVFLRISTFLFKVVSLMDLLNYLFVFGLDFANFFLQIFKLLMKV